MLNHNQPVLLLISRQAATINVAARLAPCATDFRTRLSARITTYPNCDNIDMDEEWYWFDKIWWWFNKIRFWCSAAASAVASDTTNPMYISLSMHGPTVSAWNKATTSAAPHTFPAATYNMTIFPNSPQCIAAAMKWNIVQPLSLIWCKMWSRKSRL